jgi:hypothetical protein
MDTTKSKYHEPAVVEHGNVVDLTRGPELQIEEAVGRFDTEAV